MSYEFKVFDTPKECIGAVDYVKKHHYLKSISRANKHTFVVYSSDIIIGVALFGTPVGQGVARVYGVGTLELKRFVMTGGPDNHCSWFLGMCLRYLKKHRLCSRVISYADPEQGHEGTIYKASNFKYLGTQKYRTPFVRYKRKKVFARNVYNGSIRGNLIKALIKKKEIGIQYAMAKNIFMYEFNRNVRTTTSVND